MTNKGIREIPLLDPILPKMDCPLFGVTTVVVKPQLCKKNPLTLPTSETKALSTKYWLDSSKIEKPFYSLSCRKATFWRSEVAGNAQNIEHYREISAD